jgi:hypothetical protein
MALQTCAVQEDALTSEENTVISRVSVVLVEFLAYFQHFYLAGRSRLQQAERPGSLSYLRQKRGTRYQLLD